MHEPGVLVIEDLEGEAPTREAGGAPIAAFPPKAPGRPHRDRGVDSDLSGFTNSGEATHLPWYLAVQSLLFVGLTVVAGTIRHSVLLDAPVPDDARATATPAKANTARVFT
jgi:hypothetical protein